MIKGFDALIKRKNGHSSWIENLSSIHHRVMARFLRKRGWIVFYLDDQFRECHDDCWLQVYLASETYKGK